MLRTKCPSCHSQELHLIWKEPYENIIDLLETTYGQKWDYLKQHDYTLFECQNCQLIFQEYIMGDLSQIYSSSSNTKILSNYSVHIPEVLVALHSLSLDSHSKVLDFGCGRGDFIKLVHSLNINSFYSEVYANTSLENIGIKRVDIYNSSKKFDYIYTNQVFEHLINPKEVLQKLTKLLSDNGIVKIEVPNGIGIKKRIKMGIDWKNIYKDKKKFNQIAPLEHINCFNLSSLLHLAKSCHLTPFNPMKNDIRIKRKLLGYFPLEIMNLNQRIPLSLYFYKSR